MAKRAEQELPAELDAILLQKAYARWAPVYDLVFGAVFDRGRRAAIAAAEQIGGRILEVGVGTGISLPGYSSRNRIIGIDLSEAMLRKAQRRVANLSLTNVEKLQVMDAQNLAFPDASFDVVVASHVISTVPNPEAALDECARMLKPGGEMILISRIGADSGPRQLNNYWSRSFAGSDGAQSFPGTDSSAGPTGELICAWSNAGRCHRSVISRFSDLRNANNRAGARARR